MFRLVVLSLVLATVFGAPSHLHNIHQDRYDAEGKPVYTTAYNDDSIEVHNAVNIHDNAHILGENAHLFTKEQLDNAPIVEADAFDEDGHYIHEHGHQELHHTPADTQHLTGVEVAAPVVNHENQHSLHQVHGIESVHEIPAHSVHQVHAVEDVHHVPVHSVHQVVPAVHSTENHHSLHQLYETPIAHAVDDVHHVPVHSVHQVAGHSLHQVHETPVVHAVDVHHVPVHSVHQVAVPAVHSIENHHSLHQVHETPVVHAVENVHHVPVQSVHQVAPAVHSIENHHSLHQVHETPVVHAVEDVHHVPVHSVHQVAVPSVHSIENHHSLHQVHESPVLHAVHQIHGAEGLHSLEVAPLVAPAYQSERSSSVKHSVSGPGVHVASSHSVHEVNKSPAVVGVHSLHAVPVAVSHSSRTDVHKTASIVSAPVVSHGLLGAHSW